MSGFQGLTKNEITKMSLTNMSGDSNNVINFDREKQIK